MKALLAMLKRRAQALWLWQSLFVVAVAWGFVSTHMAEQAAMSRLRFVAMDSRSTFYLTSAGSFEDSHEISAELARMAAETIFSRNPEGFDAPERLERLFNPATATQLHSEAAKDADVFRVQQVHEKLETGAVRELSVDDNTALVSVEGQILRTGVFNSKIVNQSKKVTVFLKLTVNDAMNINGRYPLVVTSYEVRYL